MNKPVLRQGLSLRFPPNATLAEVSPDGLTLYMVASHSTEVWEWDTTSSSSSFVRCIGKAGSFHNIDSEDASQVRVAGIMGISYRNASSFGGLLMGCMSASGCYLFRVMHPTTHAVHTVLRVTDIERTPRLFPYTEAEARALPPSMLLRHDMWLCRGCETCDEVGERPEHTSLVLDKLWPVDHAVVGEAQIHIGGAFTTSVFHDDSGSRSIFTSAQGGVSEICLTKGGGVRCHLVYDGNRISPVRKYIPNEIFMKHPKSCVCRCCSSNAAAWGNTVEDEEERRMKKKKTGGGTCVLAPSRERVGSLDHVSSLAICHVRGSPMYVLNVETSSLVALAPKLRKDDEDITDKMINDWVISRFAEPRAIIGGCINSDNDEDDEGESKHLKLYNRSFRRVERDGPRHRGDRPPRIVKPKELNVTVQGKVYLLSCHRESKPVLGSLRMYDPCTQCISTVITHEDMNNMTPMFFAINAQGTVAVITTTGGQVLVYDM